ncbi:MAG: hypothetical protein FJ276_35470, partial [Planctomycetes bacterium]|nr:hypothetical protein [Planctomycetota bacterium]
MRELYCQDCSREDVPKLFRLLDGMLMLRGEPGERTTLRKGPASMSEINRRQFLDDTRKATLGLAGGVTILANPGSVRATPANDRLVLAMIGVGG